MLPAQINTLKIFKILINKIFEIIGKRCLNIYAFYLGAENLIFNNGT
jgi:hypothetical protein